MVPDEPRSTGALDRTLDRKLDAFNRALDRTLDRAIEPVLARALAALGPWVERRIAVYELEEAAAIAGALTAAWDETAPDERAGLAAASPAVLAPALTLEDDATVVLLIAAPETVCRAFDDRVGRLDSHSGFGR